MAGFSSLEYLCRTSSTDCSELEFLCTFPFPHISLEYHAHISVRFALLRGRPRVRRASRRYQRWKTGSSPPSPPSPLFVRIVPVLRTLVCQDRYRWIQVFWVHRLRSVSDLRISRISLQPRTTLSYPETEKNNGVDCSR